MKTILEMLAVFAGCFVGSFAGTALCCLLGKKKKEEEVSEL